MTTLLSSKDLSLFEKLSQANMDKYEEKIIKLYTSSVEITERLVKRGFTEDYKNVVMKEIILFVTKMMIKIEDIRGLTGEDKKELLIATLIFIIIKHLPIEDDIKEVLILIIKELLPEIIDMIVLATKQMHTLTKKLKKVFLGCCN